MPKGVYTGFTAEKDICGKPGLIALLGYPAKPPKIIDHDYKSCDLIYVDFQGNQVLLNQKEVLDALAFHKEKVRYVPDNIDKGEEEAIQKLFIAINSWLERQAIDEDIQPDGTIKKKIGREAKDILSKLKSGDSSAVKRIKQNLIVTDKYKPNNFDLLTWFLVS